MMHRLQNSLMFIMLTISLVSAAVSPACAFVSGKDQPLFEICTTDGIQTILANDGQQTPPHKSSLGGKACPFCLHYTHGKLISAAQVPYLLSAVFDAPVYPEQDHALKTRIMLTPLSRGPPLLS